MDNDEFVSRMNDAVEEYASRLRRRHVRDCIFGLVLISAAIAIGVYFVWESL